MNKNGAERLMSLLGRARYSYRYRAEHISLHDINVLPQPRKTFEGIEELAGDIARKNLLNPPIVARLSRESCERYILTINLLWGTTYRVENLRPVNVNEDKTLWYYVLLAGERRLRALRALWDTGCEECRASYGPEAAGACFTRHFNTDSIEVRLCVDILPLAALFLQFSENTHMPVPPHEEAHAYALLFRLIRQASEKFTVAEFARGVGRNPETIRNALRFCELPQSIQDGVGRGLVHYGIAVEIARLQSDGETAEQLEWWMMRAVTEKKSVAEFRKLIRQYLEDKRMGQISLLAIMTENQELDYKRSHIRRVVESNTINALWALLYYLRRVRELLASGKLGKADSPFSVRSPIRVLRNVFEEEKALLPHLKDLLRPNEYNEAETLIAEGVKILKQLEERSQ